MADQDAGSRGAEDEPRGPQPEEGTTPLPSEAAPTPETTAAHEAPAAASRGGAGTAGPAGTERGYAYGPGGAGWRAPGWSRAQPAPGSSGGFRGGHRGQLVAVGLAGALIGALIGGGIVAVGGALWNRTHDHYYRVSLENRDPGAGRDPWGGSLGRRFGQDVPGPRTGRLPQFCQRTETGFRCDMPGPGGPAVPSQAPMPVPPSPVPSPS